MIRKDYVSVNGLVTGVRGAMKRQGIKVGAWYKGRITSRFSEGIEIKKGCSMKTYEDCVEIDLWGRDQEPVLKALEAEGIEYTIIGANVIQIEAEPYLESY